MIPFTDSISLVSCILAIDDLVYAGMSTFTSKGGLYERAKKRFKVSDGKKLFCYSFFERQKTEAQVLLHTSLRSSVAVALLIWAA